jgi:hypothetical protein
MLIESSFGESELVGDRVHTPVGTPVEILRHLGNILSLELTVVHEQPPGLEVMGTPNGLQHLLPSR